MPGQVTIENVQDKSNYLKNLFKETYFKDIVDRNKVRNEAEMEDLMNLVASDIGSLTNPLKIANTFKSEKKYLFIRRPLKTS